MRPLITSYLLQSGECSLAAIGTFYVHKASAGIDKANKQILPPTEEVIFKPESKPVAPGLIKYIADKKSISVKEAEDSYIDFCNEWKERIDRGETFTLATIGSIQKGEDGKMYFERENTFNFYKPVSVEEVYPPSSIEVEKNNVDGSDSRPENELEADHVVVRRSHWGWWAAVLAVIALTAIFYHLKDRKLTSSSAGSQKHIITDSASATYQVPK